MARRAKARRAGKQAEKPKGPNARAATASAAAGGKKSGLVPVELQASEIVGHVLTHFGAGYGAQRQSENPSAPPPNLQIYRKLTDLKGWHFLLLDSTLRHFDDLDWETNEPLRNQVLTAAFAHGVEARKLVVADGTPSLSLKQILISLEKVKQEMCPGPSSSAGGGRVCDF